MKLSDHAEFIRQLIDKAFRNRLGRLKINRNIKMANEISAAEDEKSKILIVLDTLRKETSDKKGSIRKTGGRIVFYPT
jgi:hypothetical protein